MIRLVAVLAVFFIACSSFPDQVPAPEEQKKDQNDTSPSSSAQLPPPSTPKSDPNGTEPSSPSETSETSPAPVSNDAGMPDAISSPADAGTKDVATPAKIAFGEPCSTHAQCADGLCLQFSGKGLRCTKACNDDDDCPSDDCEGSPKVCDID